jgi:hypothetical protein
MIARKKILFFVQGRFFVLDRSLLMGDPVFSDVDMVDGAILTSLTIYEKVLEPLYPADYDGVGIKEKSIKL